MTSNVCNWVKKSTNGLFKLNVGPFSCNSIPMSNRLFTTEFLMLYLICLTLKITALIVLPRLICESIFFDRQSLVVTCKCTFYINFLKNDCYKIGKKLFQLFSCSASFVTKDKVYKYSS